MFMFMVKRFMFMFGKTYLASSVLFHFLRFYFKKRQRSMQTFQIQRNHLRKKINEIILV